MLGDDTRERLLEAIYSGRLVLLCGAGLSRADPSSLLSAIEVANICFDRHAAIAALPPDTRDQLEQIADIFCSDTELDPYFINTLVPWDDLTGDPNDGHSAIADFLICRGAQAALSANFDTLIERSAEHFKFDLRGALTGQEATLFHDKSSPLLKFHGCQTRDRDNTVWTHRQLSFPKIDQRISTCAEWINLNLPGRDVLVLGFWSDWGYLNDVLSDALTVNLIVA